MHLKAVALKRHFLSIVQAVLNLLQGFIKIGEGGIAPISPVTFNCYFKNHTLFRNKGLTPQISEFIYSYCKT